MENKIIIFTSPSGAGKTTLVRHLLSKFPTRLSFSISATTRKQREGEENGVHYYFMDEETFMKKLRNNEFIEWEEVYKGLYYGTLRSELDRLAADGKHMILDIDVKGALNVKKQFGDRVLTIFVKPPSAEALVERLRNRGTENAAEIEKRVQRMAYELSQEKYFDKVIVNDDLETAKLEAERTVAQFIENE